MQPTHQTHTSAEMQRCIDNCNTCHDVCLETISHCLQMGGKHAEASHIRLLMDCVQICHTSADFMIRGSEFHTRTCGVCAEICEACARDCERIDPNDQHMQRCAQICRECAQSCREMAGMAA